MGRVRRTLRIREDETKNSLRKIRSSRNENREVGDSNKDVDENEEKFEEEGKL